MRIKTHHATLSQAIREGAKVRVQGFGVLVDRGNPAIPATCALGAAHEGVFHEITGPEQQWYDELERLYPYLANVPLHMCPVSKCAEYDDDDIEDMGDVIIHLNDTHRWSREAIADWLSVEEERLGYILVVDTQSAASPCALPTTEEHQDVVSAST